MVKRNKSGKQQGSFKSTNVKKHKDFMKGAKSKNASTNPDRKLPEKQEKGGYMRDKSKIKLLNMYNEKPDMDKMRIEPNQPVRVQPDRKWFGNVRTIGQKNLEEFRVEIQKQNQGSKQANQFVIKKNKLPLELLMENNNAKCVKILDLESYKDTFGPKSKRKRVKLDILNYEEMQEKYENKNNNYDHDKDRDLNKEVEKVVQKDKRLEAGQSKRIWEELYKVIDSSDVICQVLDARDPMGTRCNHIENHMKQNPHKHMVLILNKVDLIPTWLTKRWIGYLQQFYPVIAYHASVQNSYGKGSLINLLRQFDNFHKDKKNISIGFIGYPNVGKSSVINSLKQKKVCKAAPIPGETRVWQYVHLTKRIYLIDCPGVVYNYEGRDDVKVVLKGCVRAERLADPDVYIPYMLEKVQKKDIIKLYGVQYTDAEDFLKELAKAKGKLLKGGEPDIKAVSKSFVQDWQRGEIPYFELPPDYVIDEKKDNTQLVDEKIDEEFVEQILEQEQQV